MATNDTPTSAPAIPALVPRPREAAKALSMSERALWALTASGDIPCVRRGRMVLYPVAMLEKWLAEQSTGGEGGGR